MFFFNDTATTEIYTLSLHDALPILIGVSASGIAVPPAISPYLQEEALQRLLTMHLAAPPSGEDDASFADRKSTRLNSSHANISYAVFCLKKKKITSISRIHSSAC